MHVGQDVCHAAASLRLSGLVGATAGRSGLKFEAERPYEVQSGVELADVGRQEEAVDGFERGDQVCIQLVLLAHRLRTCTSTSTSTRTRTRPCSGLAFAVVGVVGTGGVSDVHRDRLGTLRGVTVSARARPQSMRLRT